MRRTKARRSRPATVCKICSVMTDETRQMFEAGLLAPYMCRPIERSFRVKLSFGGYSDLPPRSGSLLEASAPAPRGECIGATWMTVSPLLGCATFSETERHAGAIGPHGLDYVTGIGRAGIKCGVTTDRAALGAHARGAADQPGQQLSLRCILTDRRMARSDEGDGAAAGCVLAEPGTVLRRRLAGSEQLEVGAFLYSRGVRCALDPSKDSA